MTVPKEVENYYAEGKPLVCEMEENPYICEFWPFNELATYNQEYEVPEYAPGYFGFSTSGGGKMFSLAPSGEVVILPFIGMEPSAAVVIAPSWKSFEGMLKSAI